MSNQHTMSGEDAAVRATMENVVRAVRAKDVEAMLAQCTREVVIYDMVPPLRHQGAQAIRGLWARTLSAFEPPLEYELQDLTVHAGEQVAFVHGLGRFGGTRTDGRRVVNWTRQTFGLRKIDGVWKVTHEHVSVPFDMETGKAMLELKP